MSYNVQKTDEEWRAELAPEEYAVLREAATERAFTGEYNDAETTGAVSYTHLTLPTNSRV